MSGGHCNYVCWRVEEAATDMTGELKEFILDVALLLHDYEWWMSSDYGDDTWHKCWGDFRRKWLRQPDSKVEERLTKIAEKAFKNVIADLGGKSED